MSYKFKITDDEGKEYVVEEENACDEDGVDLDKEVEVHDDELTPEEIASLKELAKVAPQLLALLQPAQPTDAEEGEEVEDECEEKKVDKIYTDDEEELDEEKVITKDSFKSSVGSIQRHKTSDSSDLNDEITEAFKKRYSK